MYFQIVLRKQHSLTICKVDFNFPEEPEITIASRQLIMEPISRVHNPGYNDSYGFEGGKPDYPFPTELQNQYYDEIELRCKREIYRIRQ